MAQPTPIKRNAQGGLKDTRVNRPDIVALLDECEDLREGHNLYLAKRKEANDLIKGLGIEVPEGGEVRVAIVGEGAAYATSLRHTTGGDVEFTRKPGIRVGNTKRIE